jgi:subtilase family serine protease
VKRDLTNLNENKKRTIIAITSIIAISFLFVSPAFAAQQSLVAPTSSTTTYGQVTPGPGPELLPWGITPQTGGVPFCASVSLGTLLCYTPQILKTAYDFPTGLDGSGQTIVIVDAYGSPTVQSDLNTFDSTFGLPATTLTILCGPSWTGAKTDSCPPAFTPLTKHDAACGGVGGMVGWAEETTLDVTMAHSLAPGANIVLVVANNCFDNQLSAAESAVVQQSKYAGSIMSQSFGEADSLVGCKAYPCVHHESGTLNQANAVYSLAVQNHWTVLASSGDDGANEAFTETGFADTELTPSWPASNPFVLAVGGTQGNPYGGTGGAYLPPGAGGTLACAAGATCNTGLAIMNGGPTGCTTALRPGTPTDCFATGYGGEAAWNEANFFGVRTSTGGGVSKLYSLPSYQSGVPTSWTTVLGATVSSSGRLTPDVSFNSAILGGFLVPLGFLSCPSSSVCPGPDWGVFGGTSASSPAFAAIIALVNQKHGSPVGFINPAIYALAKSSSYTSAFHDITLGNNADCQTGCGEDGFLAQSGYDLTTGWGTPDVTNFVNLIQAYL